MLVSKS